MIMGIAPGWEHCVGRYMVKLNSIEQPQEARQAFCNSKGPFWSFAHKQLQEDLSLKRKLSLVVVHSASSVASDILEITPGSRIRDILKLRFGMLQDI